MRVWVLSDGETLPVEADGRRMRSWMLAESLVARGHDVVWWASTFSHFRKRFLYDGDACVDVGPRLQLQLLDCGGYRRHFSVARYLHHRRLGSRFREVARLRPVPDVIVSAYPKIDMAYEALRYARRHGLRVIVDVRDLWPETYLDNVPTAIRPVVRTALGRDFRRAQTIFHDADALVAMSSGVLRWAQTFGRRTNTAEDRLFHIGYPAEVASDAPRPDYLPACSVVVAYVGSFGGSYELDTICEAAQRLAQAGRRDIVFVLAGDGPRRAELTARLAGLSTVVFPGWLNHDGARRLLAHADVGLIPWNSIPDAMPNKVFEYLAAGLPLLSSLTGEMETIIDRSRIGYTYRARDVEQLIRLLRSLADDPGARRSMAEHARRLFRAQFRSSDIYEGYARHVERVRLGQSAPTDAARPVAMSPA
jgi:glycosyltransferase involved in cell wall biosynthesis